MLLPILLSVLSWFPPCDADHTEDGIVGVEDLLDVISRWGEADAAGVVNVEDLLDVINEWNCTSMALTHLECPDSFVKGEGRVSAWEWSVANNAAYGPNLWAFYGNSTFTRVVGSASCFFDAWEYASWLHHGHCPGTSLYPTYSLFDDVVPGDWMRCAIVSSSFDNPNQLTSTRRMPGFQSPPLYTGGSPSAFVNGEEWRGWGTHLELVPCMVNNVDLGDGAVHAYGFNQGPIPHNLGKTEFAGGTMQNGKSVLDASVGVDLVGYAASFLAADSDNSDGVSVFWKPVNSLTGITDGDNRGRLSFPAEAYFPMFGTARGMSLRNASFNVYRDVVQLPQLSGAQRFHRVQVGGNVDPPTADTDRGAQALFRFQSRSNKRGNIVDAQGGGGGDASTISNFFQDHGPWVTAIGYQNALLCYGINDAFTPDQFRDETIEAAAILGAAGVRNIWVVSQWTTVGDAGNDDYSRYAGAYYEVAQRSYASIHANIRSIVFINLRKILDEQYDWDPTPGQDCADVTGHLTEAGAMKAGTALWNEMVKVTTGGRGKSLLLGLP